MKTRKVKHAFTIFICEKCGKEGTLKEEIEKCEKRHHCQHEEKIYQISTSGVHVMAFCKKCNKYLEDDRSLGLNSKELQEFLKKIYEYNGTDHISFSKSKKDE